MWARRSAAVRALRGRARVIAVVAAEIAVIGFFVVVAWSGWQVLVAIGGTSLVSLPGVPARVAQSVMPIGAALFIIAELLSVREAIEDRRAPLETGEP